MKTSKVLLLIFIFLETTIGLSAQKITGKLVDDKKQPLPYANIVLLTIPDSTFVTGTTSAEDGMFSLNATARNQILRISSIGYTTLYKKINSANMGVIQIASDAQQLSEVVVKGSRPKTQLKNDALVTSIQGSPLSNLGTASDVLGQVPGVIKNNGSIEVLGKGSPLIFINGRQMRNSAELDQLSSAQIKQVEVVTTPGARYDASVNSVIRIYTLKPVGEGLGFDSRTLFGVNHYAYGLEELNFNYRKNSFDFFGMAEYENNRSRNYINSIQDTYAAKFLHQTNENWRYQRNPVYAGKLGFNYVFNEKHSAGFIYDFSYKPVDISNKSYTSMWINQVLDDKLTDNNEADGRTRQHLASGYYAGKFGQWQLETNVDAVWNLSNNKQTIDEVSTNSSNRNFATNNDITSRLLAGKAVLSRSIGKGDLSLGTEWSFVNRRDEYMSEEKFISNSNTKINENNGAFFAEMSQKFGKLTTMVGLRWEHVNSKYYDDGKKQDEQSRVYDNLFPSVTIAYPFGPVRTRLSYARKVVRPAYSQLSSNVQYVNRYTYQSGNPFLKPAYRDNLSLMANYKWINLMLEYTRLSDYIMSVYTQYGDNPEIALLQKQNAKSYDQWTAMLNISPSFGKYHPQLMAGLVAQTFDVDFNHKNIKLNNPLGIFRFNHAFNLPFDSWLNADFSWRTNGNSENLYLESSWQFDLGLYKSFNKDQWSVKIQCNDLFKTANTGVTIYNDIRKMTIDKRVDTRNFQITLRYKFNATKGKYRGTGAGTSEKDRF